MDNRELLELITQLRLDIARMESKLDKINDMDRNIKDLGLEVQEALQSTRSAHKRLDKLEHVIEQNENKREDSQKWLWRTTVGSAIGAFFSVVVAVTIYLVKG